MNHHFSQIYHSKHYYVKLYLKRNFMNFYLSVKIVIQKSLS